jgi:hypothetical protein
LAVRNLSGERLCKRRSASCNKSTVVCSIARIERASYPYPINPLLIPGGIVARNGEQYKIFSCGSEIQ